MGAGRGSLATVVCPLPETVGPHCVFARKSQKPRGSGTMVPAFLGVLALAFLPEALLEFSSGLPSVHVSFFACSHTFLWFFWLVSFLYSSTALCFRQVAA